MVSARGGDLKNPTGLPAPELIFANWRETLNFATLPPPVRCGYIEAIDSYLDYCRLNGLSVSIQSAKDFVADALRRGKTADGQLWKEGLNWFFREGRKRTRPQPPGVPTLGQADTGKAPWESRLIERLRLNHYSWRTEQTYREWARRLECSLRGRPMEPCRWRASSSCRTVSSPIAAHYDFRTSGRCRGAAAR